MQLNGVTLVDRNNRPAVLQRVALVAHFINGGQYQDPSDISGVTIFTEAANQSPSSILQGNLISPSIAAENILMHYEVSSDGFTEADPTFYEPDSDPAALSGVYKIGTGKYVVVLDGTQLINVPYTFHGSSVTLTNENVSAVGKYLDCWTVLLASNSQYQTLVNNFQLYDDTFFTTTQPIIFTSRNKLKNKHITLSSVETLKITTEITIQNKDIDDSIKNIFKDSVITNASMKIDKINDDSTTLPPTVEVSSFTDTQDLVSISSDNTMLLTFDTTLLASHPKIASFGGIVGNYRVMAKYTLLDETIITVPYYFTIS